MELDLEAVGYFPDRRTKLAVRSLLAQRAGGARALLVTGAPGVGKTALAEALAKASGAPFFYALLHSWSGDQDLLGGIDVAEAVAGRAEYVRQDGVLARVARASASHELVVLCLDELDKAPESVEGLLLDWLQSGRVQVGPGQHLSTRLERVLVVLTSNGQRPHTDALLRRVRRLRMEPMAEELRHQIAARRAEVPEAMVRQVDRGLSAVAEAAGEAAPVSLQELAHAAHEVWVACESAADAAETLLCWGVREPSDAMPRAVARRFAATAWGCVMQLRRQGAVACD